MKKVDLFSVPWVVISIDDLRLGLFRMEFRRFGLKTPFKFDGFTFSNMNGFENNTICHISIIKMAKALDFPGIVVFEDDAYPRGDAAEVLGKISEVPDDLRVLALGWIQNANPVSGKGDFLPTLGNRLFGMHAYFVPKEGYDFFIRFFSTPKINSDWILWKSKNNGVYFYRECLFIQYNFNKSNGGHYGYRFNDGLAHREPPMGFLEIDSAYGVSDNMKNG